MSRWLRMYEEILDDPKVQRLSGDDFKAWVNLLCLTSRYSGDLPPVEDIAFALRLDKKKVEATIARLLRAGLLVERNGCFRPHKWDERQYKSDVSTDRVKRFRQRSRGVSETPDETPPDTETDTETENDDDEARDAREWPTELIEITSEVCRIAGIGHTQPGHIIANHKIVQGWLDTGIDPETEIAPAIRQALAESTERISSLRWFDHPVRQAKARKEAAANGHQRSPPKDRWAGYLTEAEEADRQPGHPLSEAGEPIH
jgi:hypothetical protein